MEILVLLIPLSIVLVGVAMALFLWAVRHRQFDALEQHGMDVLDPPLVEQPSNTAEDPRPLEGRTHA